MSCAPLKDMATTLRARITQRHLLIIAIALTLFAVLLYWWLARTLYRHHDADLEDDARRVVEALAASGAPLDVLATLERSRIGLTFFMLRNGRGEILFRSSRLAATDPALGEQSVLAHAAMRGATTPEFFTVRLAQGLTRFICVPLDRPGGSYIQVGRLLGDVDLLLDVVLLGSAVLVPVVLVLTGIAAFVSARQALRPIDKIVASLESIQAMDLRRRIGPDENVDEIHRLSVAINQLLDRLNTSFTTLKEFTADVSHQLQTPMTVMRSSLDLAKNAGVSETVDYRQLCQDLSDEVDALAATLKDLRDYALADADSANMAAQAIDVSEVFGEAADVVRALAEAQDVACEVAIAPGLRVWGNAVRLRQVLLNLGENAVQFTPRGGRIEITARPTAERRQLLLRVSDNGTGISSDLLPKVFERYVRSNAGRSGLGLAIVKRIVAAHRGDVSVESKLGSGTSVSVLLPLAILE
jgi:signal transduction histidine kinase